jgi:hypothetical protein
MGRRLKARPNGYQPCSLRAFSCCVACKCFLDTLLFAGRQEKGVALNLLHDIFPVPLAMETTQRVLEGISPLEV